MHAYNRTEADQTDSIAVCATSGEWSAIINDIIEADPPTVSPATIRLFEILDRMGLV